jgi:sulfur carrier protein
MRLIVNGREENIGDVETVGELLRMRHLVPERVAVERNTELVPRGQYDTTTLAEGDQIEIVTLVGGG